MRRNRLQIKNFYTNENKCSFLQAYSKLLPVGIPPATIEAAHAVIQNAFFSFVRKLKTSKPTNSIDFNLKNLQNNLLTRFLFLLSLNLRIDSGAHVNTLFLTNSF